MSKGKSSRKQKLWFLKKIWKKQTLMKFSWKHRFSRQWPLNVNVNKLLVSRGLALFVPFPDHSSYFKTWRKLARQLVHAEKRASKKRLGIWSEPTRTQRLVAEASRRYERLRSKSPAELMGAFYGWLCAGVRKILKRNKDIWPKVTSFDPLPDRSVAPAPRVQELYPLEAEPGADPASKFREGDNFSDVW